MQSIEIKKRVVEVEKVRSKSSRETTKKLADTPYLFGEIRQTNKPYLLIPRVSSELRKFMPIGYLMLALFVVMLILCYPMRVYIILVYYVQTFIMRGCEQLRDV
jgi:hypothetical protein